MTHNTVQVAGAVVNPGTYNFWSIYNMLLKFGRAVINPATFGAFAMDTWE